MLNIKKKKAHNSKYYYSLDKYIFMFLNYILFSDLKRSKSRKNNSPTENTDSISYDNIKHIFEEETTFDNQLIIFLNAIQLSDAEIETRYQSVCTQLDKIFKMIFPKCKTYRFGSTQTGLGFKECDLDIYMDIGKTSNLLNYYFIIRIYIYFFF